MNTTIVIPNYNGMKYLPACMEALAGQDYPACLLVVDNGSTDGSVTWLNENYPDVEVISLGENTGFCRAVNIGIRQAKTPYVILLNNDTQVKEGFTKALVSAIETSENIFSVSAKMLEMKDETLVDNAGDLYCAFGWAFARGKGRKASEFNARVPVFSACGGASIYRKAVLDKIGLFDELHFAYLEDVDIGWRARIYGFVNMYEPGAQVLHAGSAASGSKYNRFKTSLASVNSVYLIGKNMPFLQWLLNLPFLACGFLVKTLFFTAKGMGGLYLKGIIKGALRCFSAKGRKNKVRFRWENLANYCRIQWEMWLNIVKRFV